MLPISQSTNSEMKLLTDFPLTASAEPYSNCGTYYTKGCLNVKDHHAKNTLLDGYHPEHEGSVYIRRFRNSCHRALCPKCWEDWANREKDRAVQRLKAFKIKGKKLKVVHLVASVPQKDYFLSIDQMRKKAYKSLKSVHALGGMLIFHPKRKRCVKCKRPKPFKKNRCVCGSYGFEWYFSPHFHILGYGWIYDVRKSYFSNGYVIVNLGIRKSVEGTIFYQLSHCGISTKKHTITWFGALSYNKIKVIYKEKEDYRCPLCSNKLRRVIYRGQNKEVFENLIEFYDNEADWYYKKNYQSYEPMI